MKSNVCRRCLKEYEKNFPHQKYCSLECSKAAQRILRACKGCGGPLPQQGMRRVFCGPVCADSWIRITGGGNLKRAIHYRVKYERIDPENIFRRDNWTCQICGRETPKALRGTKEPGAPELDHIIPMRVGGGHVLDNVQCACRDCNVKKGAKCSFPSARTSGSVAVRDSNIA